MGPPPRCDTGDIVKVQVREEIAAPADAVFAYVADLTNNSDWQSGVAATRLTDGSPMELGATYEQTLDDGKSATYVVTALEPGRSITVVTERGTVVNATITRTVHKLSEDTSRIRMELSGRVRGWRVVLTPLMRRLVTSSIRADYRRLRRTLEPADEAEA